MKGTDNLLRQALQGLDQEVRISQDDVAAAHHRFVARRAEQVRRRRSLAALAAAAAVTAVATGGALVLLRGDEQTVSPSAAELPSATESPGGPSLTPQDLAGLWVIPDNSGWVWEIHADGTMGWMNPRQGAAYEETYYQVAGDVLDTGLCAFRVRLSDAGTMTGVVTEPDGTLRDCASPAGEAWTWIRVERSGSVAASAFEGLALSNTVEPSEGVMVGVWWREDTGQALMVTSEGGGLVYRLDDDGDIAVAPDDEGEAVLSEEGELTLTSRGGPGSSGDCPAGASVTLEDISIGTYDSRLWAAPVRVLRTTSTPGVCGAHADLGGTWLHVP